MNGKKAKLIRRIAEANTVGREPVSYMQQQVQNQQNFRNIRLRTECTRYRYQEDKKQYLRSMRA